MPRFSKKAILEELTRLYPDAGPELNFTNPYETLVAVMITPMNTAVKNFSLPQGAKP